jgi:hypothetical protein
LRSWRPSAAARGGGTALPTCRCLLCTLPTKRCLSAGGAAGGCDGGDVSSSFQGMPLQAARSRRRRSLPTHEHRSCYMHSHPASSTRPPSTPASQPASQSASHPHSGSTHLGSPERERTRALTRCGPAPGGTPAPPCPWAGGRWWRWGSARSSPGGQTAPASRCGGRRCWAGTRAPAAGPAGGTGGERSNVRCVCVFSWPAGSLKRQTQLNSPTTLHPGVCTSLSPWVWLAWLIHPQITPPHSAKHTNPAHAPLHPP